MKFKSYIWNPQQIPSISYFVRELQKFTDKHNTTWWSIERVRLLNLLKHY